MTDSTCPMCAEEISPSDYVCPHCGSVLRAAPPPEPEPSPTPASAPAKSSTPWGKVAAVAGVLVVVGGGAAAWSMGAVGGASESSETLAEEPIEPDDANAPPDDVEPAAPAEEAQEAEAPEDAEAREEAEAPEEAETPPPVEMESEEASEEEPEVVSPYAPLPEPATDCDTAPECNTRGFRYYQAKDYERALPYFSAALERDPGHVKAVYNAACMFALLEDMDASITMLERLAKMDDPEAQKRIRKVARDGDFDRIRNQSKFRQAMRELRR